MIWQKVNQIVMRSKGFCVCHHQHESRKRSLMDLEEQWLAGARLLVLCCLLPLPILDLRGTSQHLLLERRKELQLPHDLGDGMGTLVISCSRKKTLLKSLWLALKWGNNHFKDFGVLAKSYHLPPSPYSQPWVNISQPSLPFCHPKGDFPCSAIHAHSALRACGCPFHP